MEDKRQKQSPLPERLNEYLNAAQMVTVKKMEGFGWELFFIRRPLFQEIITIMHLPSSGETALIEQDGNINQAHDVYVRPAPVSAA